MCVRLLCCSEVGVCCYFVVVCYLCVVLEAGVVICDVQVCCVVGDVYMRLWVSFSVYRCGRMYVSLSV